MYFCKKRKLLSELSQKLQLRLFCKSIFNLCLQILKISKKSWRNSVFVSVFIEAILQKKTTMKTHLISTAAILLLSVIGCKKKESPFPQTITNLGCIKVCAADNQQPLKDALLVLTAKNPDTSMTEESLIFLDGKTDANGDWCANIPTSNFVSLVVAKKGYATQEFIDVPPPVISLKPLGFLKFHVSKKTTCDKSIKIIDYFIHDGHKFDTTFVTIEKPGEKKIKWFIHSSEFSKNVTITPRDTTLIEIAYE